MKQRQTFKTAIACGVICLILCSPSIAQGWGAGGHMMVASIGFKRLSPTARFHVQELLAIRINPAAVSAQSRDFVNAAHWADDLRPFPEFDPLKPLHFIDTPFSVDGTPLPEVPSPNIVTALEENVNILKTSTDKNAQAQALRLIIHFVGDIHQPLHCATRVDRDHPDGDRGGNLVSIKVPGSGGKLKTTNLHSYWDGGIGAFPLTGPNFTPPALSKIPAAVSQALQGNPATNRRIHLDDPFNFSAWAEESTTVAKEVAYKGVKNGGRPNAAYRANALKAARQRVAWGGYRLAALLNAIWPD